MENYIGAASSTHCAIVNAAQAQACPHEFCSLYSVLIVFYFFSFQACSIELPRGLQRCQLQVMQFFQGIKQCVIILIPPQYKAA